MSKHTPGPWKVLEARTARGDHYGWSVWQDRERPYANSPRGNRICSTPDGTTKEAKANAQLIAAARKLIGREPIDDNESDAVMIAAWAACEYCWEGK